MENVINYNGAANVTRCFLPVIETERLILRPLFSDDADKLLEILSDPEVMRYWNTAPWESIQDSLDSGINIVLKTLLLGFCLKSKDSL